MITITFDMIECLHFDHPDGLSVVLHGGEFYGPNTRGINHEWDITDNELAAYAAWQIATAKRTSDRIHDYIDNKRS